MSNITDQEIEKLKATESEDEWNSACAEIKKYRDGQFPDNWYARIVASGLMNQIVGSFGGDPGIKIT